jgi:hypothetical protein
VNNLTLPHRTGLVYTVSEDGALRIHEQHYASALYKLSLPAAQPFAEVIIPETEYDNKKVSLTSKVFVVGASNGIFAIDLLEGAAEARVVASWENRRERDVIFKGVNKLARGFEVVTLWKDLKCTSEIKKMNINLEQTVENVKGILEENRNLHAWLESLNPLSPAE